MTQHTSNYTLHVNLFQNKTKSCHGMLRAVVICLIPFNKHTARRLFYLTEFLNPNLTILFSTKFTLYCPIFNLWQCAFIVFFRAIFVQIFKSEIFTAQKNNNIQNVCFYMSYHSNNSFNCDLSLAPSQVLLKSLNLILAFI